MDIFFIKDIPAIYQLPYSKLTLEYKFIVNEENSIIFNERKDLPNKLHQAHTKKNLYNRKPFDNVSSQDSNSTKSFFNDKKHLNKFIVNEENSIIFNERKDLPNKLHQAHTKKNLYNRKPFDNVSSQDSNSTKSFFNDKKHLNKFIVNEENSSFNRPVYRINPIYPNREKLLKIEGKVTVVYDVNIKGRVENIRILYSVPPNVFDNNVCSAMLRWIYEQNKPKSNLIVTFKFELKDLKNFKN